MIVSAYISSFLGLLLVLSAAPVAATGYPYIPFNLHVLPLLQIQLSHSVFPSVSSCLPPSPPVFSFPSVLPSFSVTRFYF